MVDNKLLNRRLVLRVTLKLLTGVAFLWIAYVFIAGFIGETETSNTHQKKFNLSSLEHNNAIYFMVNKRELLVIKTLSGFSVFWANDPIYGCRLEYANSVIKPVCIDIEYNMDGYCASKNQQLSAPKYIINPHDELMIN